MGQGFAPATPKFPHMLHGDRTAGQSYENVLTGETVSGSLTIEKYGFAVLAEQIQKPRRQHCAKLFLLF